MKVLHLAASLPSHAIHAPRINPLRVVQDFEHKEDEQEQLNREEQQKAITEKFNAQYDALHRILNTANNALFLKVADRASGADEIYLKMEDAQDALKKAKTLFDELINRLYDDVIDTVFIANCEDYNISLACDFLQ